MELVLSFVDKVVFVICVGRSSIFFVNVLGEKIGVMLKKVMGCFIDLYLVDFNEEVGGVSFL